MQDDIDRDFYYNANRADYASVAAALILTLLVHIGVYCALPDEFVRIASRDEAGDELKIEILPPKLENRKPEFIEANPFGNNEKPESANPPESFKDQRAADELPDPASKSPRPFVKGETKDSQKIVSGTSSEDDAMSPNSVLETLKRPLVQPAQASEVSDIRSSERSQPPPAGNSAQAGDSSAPASAESVNAGGQTQSDSPKQEKREEDSAAAGGKTPRKFDSENADTFLSVSKKDGESFGGDAQEKKNAAAAGGKTSQALGAPKKTEKSVSEIAKVPRQASKGRAEPQPQQEQPRPQQEERQPQPPKPEPQQIDDIPAPRPRPTLSMRIPAGPLADNPVHASTRGTVACDSRFSEFGAYQQRMLEAISRQWNLLASKYDLNTAVGTVVVIEFYLDRSGSLSKFNVLYTNSTNTGSGLCEQSILTTAPYGEWTQEMLNTFGNQDQSVRITFHYR